MKKVSQVRRTIIIMHMYMTEHVSHSFSGSPEDLRHLQVFIPFAKVIKIFLNLFNIKSLLFFLIFIVSVDFNYKILIYSCFIHFSSGEH